MVPADTIRSVLGLAALAHAKGINQMGIQDPLQPGTLMSFIRAQGIAELTTFLFS